MSSTVLPILIWLCSHVFMDAAFQWLSKLCFFCKILILFKLGSLFLSWLFMHAEKALMTSCFSSIVQDLFSVLFLRLESAMKKIIISLIRLKIDKDFCFLSEKNKYYKSYFLLVIYFTSLNCNIINDKKYCTWFFFTWLPTFRRW